MKVFAGIASVAFLAAVVALVVMIAVGPTGHEVQQPGENRVTADLGQLSMLEVDQQMLGRMRVSVLPGAGAIFDHHPMWSGDDMIQLQEEYQAQLDRMIGRRTGQS